MLSFCRLCVICLIIKLFRSPLSELIPTSIEGYCWDQKLSNRLCFKSFTVLDAYFSLENALEKS